MTSTLINAQYLPYSSSGGWNGRTPGVNVTDPIVWGHPGVIVTSPVQENFSAESRYPQCVVIRQCDTRGNCNLRQMCND